MGDRVLSPKRTDYMLHAVSAWGFGFVLYSTLVVSPGFMYLMGGRSLLFYAMVNEVPDGKMWNRFFTA